MSNKQNFQFTDSSGKPWSFDISHEGYIATFEGQEVGHLTGDEIAEILAANKIETIEDRASLLKATLFAKLPDEPDYVNHSDDEAAYDRVIAWVKAPGVRE